ncbi:MAG: hypothetical protein IJH34_06805 [Romboutsia sp.]|nr:hypothetical protein [Romboutsia sp.]
MEKVINFFNNLSIKGEARAIKVGIATLIAVYISSKIKIIDATTSSITIFLVYATFFTVSGSRKYAKQRIISNVYALVISVVIGVIFNWNTYALALVFFLVMLVFFKLNLGSKVSLVSSGAAAMIFYVGVGNETQIIHRFASIIVGFIIAIVTNELILPTNNGLIVENNIKKLIKRILEIKSSIIQNEKLDEVNLKELLSQTEAITININLLENEIKSKPFRNHLKQYKEKLDLFKLLGDLSKQSYLLLEYLYESREIFNNLEVEDKYEITNILSNLYDNYKIVIDKVKDNTNKSKNIEIIRYDNLKLDNKFNIILLSRFLECKDAIIKLNEYLNSKECV